MSEGAGPTPAETAEVNRLLASHGVKVGEGDWCQEAAQRFIEVLAALSPSVVAMAIQMRLPDGSEATLGLVADPNRGGNVVFGVWGLPGIKPDPEHRN